MRAHKALRLHCLLNWVDEALRYVNNAGHHEILGELGLWSVLKHVHRVRFLYTASGVHDCRRYLILLHLIFHQGWIGQFTYRVFLEYLIFLLTSAGLWTLVNLL